MFHILTTTHTVMARMGALVIECQSKLQMNATQAPEQQYKHINQSSKTRTCHSVDFEEAFHSGYIHSKGDILTLRG